MRLCNRASVGIATITFAMPGTTVPSLPRYPPAIVPLSRDIWRRRRHKDIVYHDLLCMHGDSESIVLRCEYPYKQSQLSPALYSLNHSLTFVRVHSKTIKTQHQDAHTHTHNKKQIISTYQLKREIHSSTRLTPRHGTKYIQWALDPPNRRRPTFGECQGLPLPNPAVPAIRMKRRSSDALLKRIGRPLFTSPAKYLTAYEQEWMSAGG